MYVGTYIILSIWGDVATAEKVALEVCEEGVEFWLKLPHDEVGACGLCVCVCVFVSVCV